MRVCSENLHYICELVLCFHIKSELPSLWMWVQLQWVMDVKTSRNKVQCMYSWLCTKVFVDLKIFDPYVINYLYNLNFIAKKRKKATEKISQKGEQNKAPRKKQKKEGMCKECKCPLIVSLTIGLKI